VLFGTQIRPQKGIEKHFDYINLLNFIHEVNRLDKEKKVEQGRTKFGIFINSLQHEALLPI
jgi:hypothetical protein